MAWLISFYYFIRQNSKNVTPGFDIGNIIDLSDSSRIKFHPV